MLPPKALKLPKEDNRKKKLFFFLMQNPTYTKKTRDEITATKFWKLESQCISVKGFRRTKKARP